MTWKSFFTSSVGKKFTMGVTGFFLISFLIVHVGLNASIFVNDNGETFNSAAHFMSHNWIVRFLELGLFAGLILHIIQGLMLWRQNKAARPVDYYAKKSDSTWYSRSMGVLGTLVLLFLIMHLSHFWLDTKKELYGGGDSVNLYAEMSEIFSHWWVVLLYVLGVTSLFWHLIHGFQSAFQTLGLKNKNFNSIIKSLGIGYSIIVCLLFILMPLAFFFGWITYTP